MHSDAVPANWDPYSGSCSNCGGSMYWVEEWGTCRGTEYGPGYIGVNSAKGKIYWKDRWWYFEFSNASNGQGGYGQPTRTLYNYRTRQEYKNIPTGRAISVTGRRMPFLHLIPDR